MMKIKSCFIAALLVFVAGCSVEKARQERLDLLMSEVKLEQDKYIECVYSQSNEMAFYREDPYAIAVAVESRCAPVFSLYSRKAFEFFEEQQRGNAVRAKAFTEMTINKAKDSSLAFSVDTIIKRRNGG